MELLETPEIQYRRHRKLFADTIDHRILVRYSFYSDCVFYDHLYLCAEADVLACIIMFIGGIQLFCMGIMGQYLSKTYMEVKKRPHYIIRESNRKDEIQKVQ